MQILGNPVSEHFVRFYERARAELGVPIEIEALQSEFPMDGRSELREDKLLIQLRPSFPPEKHEITLAHEIAHGLLRFRRYPVLAPADSSDLQDPIATFLVELPHFGGRVLTTQPLRPWRSDVRARPG